MLYLIGFGIGNEKGISLGAVEALKECEIIFLEDYTNIVPDGTVLGLEKIAGRKISILGRGEVEGEKKILESAGKKKTALLVSGDPMIATTHVSLLISAKKRGIEAGVFHSSSILSAAIGESGLQAYRFGKIVTIPKWKKNFKPMSPYDVIEENLKRNLHTLLLLDLDEKGAHLSPKEALRELLEMEEEKKGGLITSATNFMLLSKIGRPGQRRIYSQVAALLDGHTDDLPAVLILPAKLHFLEEEFLQEFCVQSGL